MGHDGINPELVAQVESTIGPFQIVVSYRSGSERTGVWKIQSSSHRNQFFLKTFSRLERWYPEVYAYKHWIKVLHPFVPELIGAYRGENWQAILITPLEGIIMRETSLDSDKLYHAYTKAGQLTRILHQSKTGEWFGRPGPDGKPIELYSHRDPVNYIYNSMTELFEKCKERNLLTQHEIKLAEWAIKETDVFRGSKPVPISWDSTPGNWLVDRHGNFIGMIDFENMLWGIDVDQFSILFERYFLNDNRAKDAFFSVMERILETQMRICSIKLAIGDILYGTQRNVPRFIEYGRNLLKRLSEDHRVISF